MCHQRDICGIKHSYPTVFSVTDCGGALVRFDILVDLSFFVRLVLINICGVTVLSYPVKPITKYLALYSFASASSLSMQADVPIDLIYIMFIYIKVRMFKYSLLYSLGDFHFGTAIRVFFPKFDLSCLPQI